MAITRFFLDRTSTSSSGLSSLLRRSCNLQPIRHSHELSTDSTLPAATPSTPAPRRKYPPPPPHDYSKPCNFLGSWTPPSDPRVAQANLERLRRGYAKQVRQLRKEYAYEVEMLRIEKQRKDEARKEAARISNEERKKAKALEAQTRAAKQLAIQEEFRQTLLKERAEKLESWKAKMKMQEGKKKEKKELLRKQSSIWVSEENLDDRVFRAIIDTTSL